ncbi:unnamed protein product [Cuscuta campestris]|uniref:Uncharacterized protein n=1 Tax=Cuscuta campestris TaxID=132261 RepID=A0A484ND21_9ASTE|nr:unnamed protein product [Cuscuta campestris]
MVTRSRAKLISAGRKEHPIKGVDTSEDEFTVEGIRSAFKESCPTIKERKIQLKAPPLEPHTKLSKKQKRKAKLKLKQAQAMEMTKLALDAKYTLDKTDFEDEYGFSN